MTDNRPIILWTCDVPGWAYHNRIVRISAVLIQYRHVIWYFGSRLSKREQQEIVDSAAVIVCQGVKSLRLIELKSLDFTHGFAPEVVLAQRYINVVARLDSVRVDFEGEYYDLWTGEQLPK